MPGMQLADRAGAVGAGLVGGDHRRGFGDAIAFEQFDRIFLAQQRAGLVAQPFGAADRQPQRIQIALVAGARILRDEGVRRQQDRRARGADAAHDFARLQGRRMEHRLDAEEQRHQRADRQPEAVKGRQRIEQDVARVERNMRAHLFDIGQQIDMAKRHALGIAFGARGEEDDGRRLVQRSRGDQRRHELADRRPRSCRPGVRFSRTSSR